MRCFDVLANGWNLRTYDMIVSFMLVQPLLADAQYSVCSLRDWLGKKEKAPEEP